MTDRDISAEANEEALSPEQYRELAARLRKLAEAESDEKRRLLLLQINDAYEGLARLGEASERLACLAKERKVGRG